MMFYSNYLCLWPVGELLRSEEEPSFFFNWLHVSEVVCCKHTALEISDDVTKGTGLSPRLVIYPQPGVRLKGF